MKRLFIGAMALMLIGGGCLPAAPEPVEPLAEPKAMPTTVSLNGNVRFSPDLSWDHEVVENGNKVLVNECPLEDDSYFCETEVYVSEADTPADAVIAFADQHREFAWNCHADSGIDCESREEKAKLVMEAEGYSYAHSLGIAEIAAVAFKVKDVYVVVFAWGTPDESYQKYQSRFE